MTVTLRSGTEITHALAVMLSRNLSDMRDHHPEAFFQLVLKCRDDHFVIISPEVRDLLGRRSMLELNGSVCETVRDIVLSVVEGDDMHVIPVT